MNRREFAQSLGAGLVAPPIVNSIGAQLATPEMYPDSVDAPYQLSVMLWTILRDLPFEQRLEKVARAGYRNVELVGEYSKWKDEDFSRAIAKSKELGIRFDCTAGLKHSLSNPADREGLIAEFRETLPTMERLQCPAMIVLSGNTVPGMSFEAQAQSCVEGLNALAAVVNGKKIAGEPVRLLLENIDPEENPKYFLTSVARGFEIIKAVNHPQVQFCYDLFHEQIAEGNLIEKLERNMPLVGLIHVADVPGRHKPGTGEINYASIFRKLVELKYNRVVAMEFLPLADPVEELRAARKMALGV
ncbi:MAG TPA: TIM barrel protein [Terriglobales bacterium]|jgi:hydroxypyruvate isomerase|nr:TIM barrel protein [Terriglobales bacterium]